MDQGVITSIPGVAGLGRYPVEFDVSGLPGRRIDAATRKFALASAFGALATMLVGGVVIAAETLKEPIPVVVGYDLAKGEVGEARVPFDRISGDYSYVESMADEYVRLRHRVSFDAAEMAELWADKGRLSNLDATPDGFEGIEKVGIMAATASIKAGRQVEAVIVDSRPTVQGKAFRVDFDLVVSDRSGAAVSRTPMTAYVETAFDPAKGDGDKLMNPLGFQVTAYSEEPRRAG